MRICAFALAASLLATGAALAEDCAKLPSQTGQIACLQRTVDELRRQVEELTAAQSADAVTNQSLERVIDERIRRATAEMEEKLKGLTEPRLQLLDACQSRGDCNGASSYLPR